MPLKIKKRSRKDQEKIKKRSRKDQEKINERSSMKIFSFPIKFEKNSPCKL